jgi:hypothetical protein
MHVLASEKGLAQAMITGSKKAWWPEWRILSVVFDRRLGAS